MSSILVIREKRQVRVRQLYTALVRLYTERGEEEMERIISRAEIDKFFFNKVI